MHQSKPSTQPRRTLRSGLLVAVFAAAGAGSLHASPRGDFDGTVERVWDDGFQLNTGARRITVDSYDLCGDFTHRRIAEGEQLRVTGEFDGGEFDAFTLVRADGRRVCG